LIRHGENVKTVQRRMGHSSSATTLDTYTHLWPDFDDRNTASCRARAVSSCGHCADNREIILMFSQVR